MTIDVNTPEFKDAVKAAAETQVAEQLETVTTGLKNKNSELLGKLTDLNSKFKDVDPEEYRSLKSGKREKEDKESDPVKLRERIEGEFTPKLTAAEQRAQDAEGKLNARIIDGDLTNALSGAKVVPEMIPAVKALLQTSRKIEVSDDGKAIIDSKPVSDFVKTWSGSDEAKPFIAAPKNNGGGSGGGSGSEGAGGKKSSEMTAQEKADYILEHGADAFKQKVDKER